MRNLLVACPLPWIIGGGIWAGTHGHPNWAAAALVLTVGAILYLAEAARA